MFPAFFLSFRGQKSQNRNVFRFEFRSGSRTGTFFNLIFLPVLEPGHFSV